MTGVLTACAIIVLGLIPAAIARRKGHPFLLWWLYGAVLFAVALPHAIITDRLPEGSAGRWRTGGRFESENGMPFAEHAPEAFDGWGTADESRTEPDPSPVWDEGFARINRMGFPYGDTPCVTPRRSYRRSFPAAVALLSGGVIALFAAVTAELPAPTLGNIEGADGHGRHNATSELPRPDPAPPSPQPESRQPVTADERPASIPDRTAFLPPLPPPAAVALLPSPADNNAAETAGRESSPSDTSSSGDAAVHSELPEGFNTASPDRDAVRASEEQNSQPAPTRPRPRQRPAPAEDVQAVGETVAWLQRGLRKFGYYHGPIDGRAGALTEQAIRNYQRSRHLTPHGRINYALLVSLRRSLEEARDPEPAPHR
jgi:hypothetical protein